MKREDAIEKLCECYQNYVLLHHADKLHFDGLACAEHLMKFIEEKLKMRPPVEGSIRSQMAAIHNEWEPEDELPRV